MERRDYTDQMAAIQAVDEHAKGLAEPGYVPVGCAIPDVVFASRGDF